LAKNELSLIGYITRASVSTCQIGGPATVLTATLPWHVRYRGFTGLLPNITELRTTVTGAGMQIMEPSLGLVCLTLTTAGEPIILAFRRETTTTALTTSEVSGDIASSCGIRAHWIGSGGTATVLNSTTRISVTLI
jgi:hypothetical protein